MLLNLLSKEEKGKFLDLLLCVIIRDGKTTQSEEAVINKFKNEMGEEASRFRRSNTSLDKLVEYFVDKPQTTKNLVYYNIVSASLNDEFYSVEEHILIEEIQQKLGVSARKRTEIMKTVYAERDIREKVKRVITEWLFKEVKIVNQHYI